jgi:hypothetical protein
MPAGERLVTRHAADLTAQLEVALRMLAVAIDLVAVLSGRDADDVYAALEQACT